MSVTPSMGVVTPEAVVLEFRAAGLATRTIAKLIDLLVQALLLFLVVLIASVGSGPGGRTTLVIIIALGVFTVVVLAPALSETFWNGRTPGKAVMGLRVVTTDGGPISFRHAIMRGLLQIVEIPTAAAILVALGNRRSQRLGDLAAGTFVISERAATDALMTPTVFFPPPGGEMYCHQLDVSRVDSEQFLLVRNFLLRVNDLDGAARAALAVQLADPLRAMCAPEPPRGMPAEVFLVCVCSAYQVRHGGLPAQPGARWAG